MSVLFYILFWIVIWGLLGAIVGESKGSPMLGFLLSILLGPIGVLITVLLSKDENALRRKALGRGMRECPACGELVQGKAALCRYCGTSLVSPPSFQPPTTAEPKYRDMSHVSQGPDWWLASDGKWYPPDRHPSYRPPLPPPPPSPSPPVTAGVPARAVPAMASPRQTMHSEGWQPDPFMVHEERFLDHGKPTPLVKDGGVGSYDAPPPSA